ncbi:hypothetical protein F2Q69_00012790 [Brassica cretica]|uniref:Uncharacterized protein n=1 Tax=Brassica cretica TaxID=69181 RepID=A0A8S9R7I8_BRACR|nr:hypothetical protein F2Q69_00012790 [Brassica cretica]
MCVLLEDKQKELHRRIRCLAMDGDLSTVRLSPSVVIRYSFELDFQFHRFEVNQHPIAEFMLVLLKSGQSASPEETVEEMKDFRSTVHPWCRSTVMPDMGRGDLLYAADGMANQAAEPSMKDVLEAMKVMGNQVVAMTQLFTPLVNSLTNDRKREWDQVEGGKASSDKHEFPKCGRRHPGDAGRSWGLVFDAAAWIRQSGTALDQGQPRADQVEAALRLVSIVASLGTSRRNVRSCRRDKERAVQTLVGQTRVGRPQLLECTSCPRTTALMDRTSRSSVRF